MTRRDLIQKVLLGGATLMVVPSVLESCSKQDNGIPSGSTDKLTLDLTDASYSALNSAGGSVVVSGIIIANTGSNVFVALDSTCTHAGCTISYNNSNKNFPCPCHGSIFSTSGSVLNGPAATALKTHNVTRSGDILTVSL
jgi:cytochrome b6-f complex iron-sulfur subunit